MFYEELARPRARDNERKHLIRSFRYPLWLLAVGVPLDKKKLYLTVRKTIEYYGWRFTLASQDYDLTMFGMVALAIEDKVLTLIFSHVSVRRPLDM